MRFTAKTYYMLGVLSGALTVAGGALLFFGTYVPAVYSVATVTGGLMMLLVGGTATEKVQRIMALIAALLLLFSMASASAGVVGVAGTVCGALAWPLFALPLYRDSEDNTSAHTMAGLVLVTGAVQLLGSFIAMPGELRIVISVAIGAVQAVFAWVMMRAQTPQT